jgi:hypothetical protein
LIFFPWKWKGSKFFFFKHRIAYWPVWGRRVFLAPRLDQPFVARPIFCPPHKSFPPFRSKELGPIADIEEQVLNWKFRNLNCFTELLTIKYENFEL